MRLTIVKPREIVSVYLGCVGGRNQQQGTSFVLFSHFHWECAFWMLGSTIASEMMNETNFCENYPKAEIHKNDFQRPTTDSRFLMLVFRFPVVASSSPCTQPHRHRLFLTRFSFKIPSSNSKHAAGSNNHDDDTLIWYTRRYFIFCMVVHFPLFFFNLSTFFN